MFAICTSTSTLLIKIYKTVVQSTFGNHHLVHNHAKLRIEKEAQP